MRLPVLGLLFTVLVLASIISPASAALRSDEAHVWDVQEVVAEAQHVYANPYTDVVTWIDLKGPGFEKCVYGFWDGGLTFRYRFVATAPGTWQWRIGSNQPSDAGLNGGNGSFRAVPWTQAEIEANPNRHGFIRATANGHALQYADGTPFFLVGDTWLAASTWRLPYRGGKAPPADYVPGPRISFEDAVTYRERQGFNSISFISAFPNWAADSYGATFADSKGVPLRNAWEKFGVWAPNATITTADGATTTAKDMQDENGDLAFAVTPNHGGMADFDRVNPAYFQHLDLKMRYLADQGFIALFEPVRRDTGPSWKAYFDFNASYARYVEYLAARYGAYNLIFSGIHLDWVSKQYSLTAEEYNTALNGWLKTYGGLPFGQPMTSLIDGSTYRQFGQAPWITMQTVGNKPRDHGIYPFLEEIFRLNPAVPGANLEPYYAGWNHEIDHPAGEAPAPDSDRDDYFARSMMYGSVLSGGLSGHVFGTGAYDVTTTGEPAGWRPYIWEALRYKSGGQMQYLRRFMLSEGTAYQDLKLASEAIHPRTSSAYRPNGLDGQAYMMRSDRLALLYFESEAARVRIDGFASRTVYRWTWFDPRGGQWSKAISIKTDAQGTLAAPAFPVGGGEIFLDWAAKVVR